MVCVHITGVSIQIWASWSVYTLQVCPYRYGPHDLCTHYRCVHTDMGLMVCVHITGVSIQIWASWSVYTLQVCPYRYGPHGLCTHYKCVHTDMGGSV